MRTDHRWWPAIAATVLLLAVGCSPTAPTRSVRASFAELARTISATVGLAIAPVGRSTVFTFGTWSTGVAWSTIKVPLAIAALRVEGINAYALATKAITQSDNAAAEQLWARLGPPERAARQVQDILREGGDAVTAVESRRLRPGFTAFGQTRWDLQQQARFAAGLPCLTDTGGVVELMHDLIAEQRWGLAASGSAAKGGWGPGESSGYLVRQFGIVSTPAGLLGVALAAEPYDGTLGAGVQALDQVAHWLTGHRAELPGGSCSR